MKKFQLALVVLCLSMSAFAQQRTVRIPEISGPAGSVVVAPILISPASGATALEMTIRVPQGLSLIANPVRGGDALADHSFAHNIIGDEITIVVFSTSLAPFSSNGGSVVQVLVRLSGQAADGTSLNLQFQNAVASDSEGQILQLETGNGEIRVSGIVSPPIEGQNRLIFPQVANGSFQGGSFGVTLIVANLTNAEATSRVRFIRSDGTPFVISLASGATDSEFSIDLAPSGTAFIESSGQGNLGAGYAVLDSSAPIGGTLLFTLRGTAGTRLSEAGVGDSPAGRSFAVPVSFEQGAFDSGLALANLGGAAALVQLTLKDATGTVIETSEVEIAGGEHLSRFASELFPLVAQQAEFEGRLEISSDRPISVISLRQLSSGLLTTLPVLPLESES